MLCNMTDVQTVIDRYIDVWNATVPQRRRELIAEVFAEDAAYPDPLAAVRGHEAIHQCVSAAQAQFAGLQFSLGGPMMRIMIKPASSVRATASWTKSRQRWRLLSTVAVEGLAGKNNSSAISSTVISSGVPNAATTLKNTNS